MVIFEVFFNNGAAFEDNERVSNFYETYAEAREAFEKFTWDFYYSPKFATLAINELELGTQKRTKVYSRKFAKHPAQRQHEEAESRVVCDDAEEIDPNNIVQTALLGDLEALAALRAKLVGTPTNANKKPLELKK